MSMGVLKSSDLFPGNLEDHLHTRGCVWSQERPENTSDDPEALSRQEGKAKVEL